MITPGKDGENMKIALVQPRYPHGKSQIYLPGGVMNLGGRLIDAGLDVRLVDRNLDPLPDPKDYDVIGYSVLGPPYIPGAITEMRQLRAMGFAGKLLVGGEGVARLDPSDFERWFGGLGCTEVTDDKVLCENLGLRSILPAYATSMRLAIQTLPEERQRLYLTREFCLYLSQGCKFNCDFCIALKNTPETYHGDGPLGDELSYICERLQLWGHNTLSCYISNLDAFQTPKLLEKRLELVSQVAASYRLVPKLRALATSRCTVQACREDLTLAKRLRSYGLEIVAFGADGADREAWKREHKAHNTLPELQEAFVCMKEAGITTEFLMVIGFQSNPALALLRALQFSLEKAWHGAVIRPYLGKSKVPGNGHWDRNDLEVQNFLTKPETLLRMDYAMVGSKETHPDTLQRYLSNAIYLAIIALLAPLGLCPTRPLMPVPARGIGRWFARTINHLMPFDR